MFTYRERFVASEIWMRLWFIATFCLALYCLFKSLDISLAALRSPSFLLLTLFAIPATLLLTLIVSPVLAYGVFSGMTEKQARLNGGPFSVGDRAIVISGRNAGASGTITSYGQCQTLRITFDGDESEQGPYSHYHLKRCGEPCCETE